MSCFLVAVLQDIGALADVVDIVLFRDDACQHCAEIALVRRQPIGSGRKVSQFEPLHRGGTLAVGRVLQPLQLGHDRALL